MYLQYRKIKNKYELILANNRPDEDNEAILRGDYLDKAPKYTEDGEEIPFEMLSKEQLLKDCIFPEWQDGDILVIAPQPLRYPKLSEDGQTLIEMTREEVCATRDLSVLGDGEKFQDGHIVQVPNPSTKYLRYNWNRNTFEWELATTKEELMNLRKNKILKYAELKKEIETLTEFSDEFESDNTIEMLKKQMEQLKKEINELLQIIKKM